MKKGTTFFEKMIYFLLSKLFSKSYKKPFSRKMYKGFFKLIQKKKHKEINLDLDGKELVSKLSEKGWVELKEQGLPQDFLELKQDSIMAALKIFDNDFKTNRTLKAYLKGIDLKKYKEQTQLFNRFFTHPYFINPISNYLGDLPLLTELKI